MAFQFPSLSNQFLSDNKKTEEERYKELQVEAIKRREQARLILSNMGQKISGFFKPSGQLPQRPPSNTSNLSSYSFTPQFGGFDIPIPSFIGQNQIPKVEPAVIQNQKQSLAQAVNQTQPNNQIITPTQTISQQVTPVQPVLQQGQLGQIQPQQPQTPQFGADLEKLRQQVLSLQGQIGQFQPPQPTPQPVQDAYTQTQKDILEAQKISPEEEQAQKQLDALASQYRLGQTAIQDKPIAMEFITGQQAALERRAGALSELPTRQLALAQGKRQAALDVAKTKLGFEEAREKRATEVAKLKQPEYKEVDGQLVKIDPTTGQVSKVFGEAKKEKQEGVTLSPGQIRFERDPETGELRQVATGGPRQLTETEIAKALEKTEKQEEARTTQTQTIGLVNSILGNSQLGFVSGVSRFFGAQLAGTAGIRGQLAQLKALTSLEGRNKLKGSGTISDFEAGMLADSANALNFAIGDDGRVAMSDRDVKRNLQNIKGTLLLKAGQSVPATITNPATDESVSADLTRKEAEDLWLDGNIIDFQ